MSAQPGENFQGSGSDDVFTCPVHGKVDELSKAEILPGAAPFCGLCLREKFKEIGVHELVHTERTWREYASSRFGLITTRREYDDEAKESKDV